MFLLMSLYYENVKNVVQEWKIHTTRQRYWKCADEEKTMTSGKSWKCMKIQKLPGVQLITCFN